MSEERVKLIHARLTEAFEPVELLIKDQSQLHIGHAGAKDGRGHFDVYIVASAFADKNRLQRHRMVHDTLKDLLETDIHALRIKATAPGEP